MACPERHYGVRFMVWWIGEARNAVDVYRYFAGVLVGRRLSILSINPCLVRICEVRCDSLANSKKNIFFVTLRLRYLLRLREYDQCKLITKFTCRLPQSGSTRQCSEIYIEQFPRSLCSNCFTRFASCPFQSGL